MSFFLLFVTLSVFFYSELLRSMKASWSRSSSSHLVNLKLSTEYNCIGVAIFFFSFLRSALIK